MTDVQLLKKVLDFTGENGGALALKIGFSRQMINNIESGKNVMTEKVKAAIFKHYPDINPRWLFYEEGTIDYKVPEETCNVCALKEQRIRELTEMIEMYRENLQALQGMSGKERKAG